MRLAVNQDGDRMDASVLGDGGVHATNVLTVIASESYQDFVGGLQTETLAELRERPTLVDQGFFANRRLVTGDGREVGFSAHESTVIYHYMVLNEYVDVDGKVTDGYRAASETGQLTQLPDELVDKTEAVHQLIKSVYDEYAFDGLVINGLATKISTNRLNDNAQRQEWKELWRRINHKYAYSVSFDSAELCEKAVAEIDRSLSVGLLRYTVTRGIQEASGSRESLEAGEHFGGERTSTALVEGLADSQVRYDLVGEVARGATITRASAALILGSIAPAVFAQFELNPEESSPNA